MIVLSSKSIRELRSSIPVLFQVALNDLPIAGTSWRLVFLVMEPPFSENWTKSLYISMYSGALPIFESEIENQHVYKQVVLQSYLSIQMLLIIILAVLRIDWGECRTTLP